MRLNVHINELVVNFVCSDGSQTLRWLGSAACMRYSIERGDRVHQYVPLGVLTQDGTVLNPERQVKDTVEEDGDIWVQIGEGPRSFTMYWDGRVLTPREITQKETTYAAAVDDTGAKKEAPRPAWIKRVNFTNYGVDKLVELETKKVLAGALDTGDAAVGKYGSKRTLKSSILAAKGGATLPAANKENCLKLLSEGSNFNALNTAFFTKLTEEWKILGLSAKDKNNLIDALMLIIGNGAGKPKASEEATLALHALDFLQDISLNDSVSAECLQSKNADQWKRLQLDEWVTNPDGVKQGESDEFSLARRGLDFVAFAYAELPLKRDYTQYISDEKAQRKVADYLMFLERKALTREGGSVGMPLPGSRYWQGKNPYGAGSLLQVSLHSAEEPNIPCDETQKSEMMDKFLINPDLATFEKLAVEWKAMDWSLDEKRKILMMLMDMIAAGGGSAEDSKLEKTGLLAMDLLMDAVTHDETVRNHFVSGGPAGLLPLKLGNWLTSPVEHQATRGNQMYSFLTMIVGPPFHQGELYLEGEEPLKAGAAHLASLVKVASDPANFPSKPRRGRGRTPSPSRGRRSPSPGKDSLGAAISSEQLKAIIAADLVMIKQILYDEAPLLKEVFSTYLSFNVVGYDAVDSMGLVQFVTLCKDAAIIGKNGCTKSDVEVVFNACVDRSGKKSGTGKSGSGLSMEGFLVALVRLSSVVYPEIPKLSERVSRLLRDDLAQHQNPMMSELKAKYKEINEPAVKAVLERYRLKCIRIFKHAVSGGKKNLTLSDFLSIVKEWGIINTNEVTQVALRCLFLVACINNQPLNPRRDEIYDMSAEQFVNVCAALSVFSYDFHLNFTKGDYLEKFFRDTVN